MISRGLIIAVALYSAGCVVATLPLSEAGFSGTLERRPSRSPDTLPQSAPRLVETLVSTDGRRVTSKHIATRADAEGWRERFSVHTEGRARPLAYSTAPRAYLPSGLPDEMTRWLALAEYYWQVGGRGHALKHKSSDRMYRESRRGSLTNQAIRQVIRFTLGDHVVCAAQRKIYDEMIHVRRRSPNNLLEQYLREVTKTPELMNHSDRTGISEGFVMQVFELPDNMIRLELHHGITQLSPPSGAVDSILVCSMPKDTRPDALGRFSAWQTQDGVEVLFDPTQPFAWAR